MRTISLAARIAKEFAPDGKLSELGPTRLFEKGHQGPVVLPIKGRRFFVAINTEYDDDGIPEPGHVMFIETDGPETPYTLWDGIIVTKDRLEARKGELAALVRRGPDGYEQWHEEEFERLRKAVERHELAIRMGESLYRPCGHTAFGQPKWIQGAFAPLHEGKPAYHLMTLETEWGDAGNENYMVALDDDGWPVAVYFEASCC